MENHLFYHRLRVFYLKYGHCYVPKDWSYDIELGEWFDKTYFNYKELSDQDILQLKVLGFEPNDSERIWFENFMYVYDQNKTQKGSVIDEAKYKKVKMWLRRQKQKAWAGKLEPKKRELLVAIGVDLPEEYVCNVNFLQYYNALLVNNYK